MPTAAVGSRICSLFARARTTGRGRLASDASSLRAMRADIDPLLSSDGVYSVADADRVLARVFGGARPLRLESALFEAMLEGWQSAQAARYLSRKTVRANLATARLFCERVECWPWEWRRLHVDEFFEDLFSRSRPVTRSTGRGYQARLRMFLNYLTDQRYPWVAICRREFDQTPVQLFDGEGLLAHLDDFEGDAARRPLTVAELETFFAACEARIGDRRSRQRKGTLTAWRDQALFKVIFGWGLRRGETAMLDMCDFRGSAKLPEFGEFAQLHVRHGKAKRGGSAQRRTVLTVFDWSAEVAEQYVTEIRPCFNVDDPALFVTERGERISAGYISERFCELHEEAGLPAELTTHCLRHSYVTYLAEEGWANQFIQDQVGHSHAATTAVYLSVSDDFKDRVVRAAIDAQLRAFGSR
jgi:site-specific recombinase XerD